MSFLRLTVGSENREQGDKGMEKNPYQALYVKGKMQAQLPRERQISVVKRYGRSKKDRGEGRGEKRRKEEDG